MRYSIDGTSFARRGNPPCPRTMSLPSCHFSSPFPNRNTSGRCSLLRCPFSVRLSSLLVAFKQRPCDASVLPVLLPITKFTTSAEPCPAPDHKGHYLSKALPCSRSQRSPQSPALPAHQSHRPLPQRVTPRHQRRMRTSTCTLWPLCTDRVCMGRGGGGGADPRGGGGDSRTCLKRQTGLGCESACTF